MEVITELTVLKVGNRIYAPKLNKDFKLVGYSYSQIYKDMLAHLEPEDKNEKGFQITLSNLMALEYEVY